MFGLLTVNEFFGAPPFFIKPISAFMVLGDSYGTVVFFISALFSGFGGFNGLDRLAGFFCG